jgi:hypothetical protein
MIKLTWRYGELSFKEFQQLNKIAKQEYLLFLQKVPKNQLSYNDQYILLLYIRVEPEASNKFLEL